MSHRSADVVRLDLQSFAATRLAELPAVDARKPGVFLFWLPFAKPGAGPATAAVSTLKQFCGRLPGASTVCVLTSPSLAAELLPSLQATLKFQLWVAVQTTPDAFPPAEDCLPTRHAALLVLTRDRGSLRHTKTRIGYTYCPACGKTTKDYGGKKHTYDAYGTLMSDVWRDVECDPARAIGPILDRLRDVFGLGTASHLTLIDLRSCPEIVQGPRPTIEPLNPAPAGTPAPIEGGLIQGDCLEVLSRVPDNSIDFCFTDPPYNIQKKYDSWNDALEARDYFSWCDRWLSALGRVLKPGGSLAVLNIPLWAVRHYQHLSTFLNFQNWIVWEGLSLPVRMIMPAHYGILCFSKGGARPLPGLSASDRERVPGERDALAPLNDHYCLRAACVARRENDRTKISDLWSDVHRLKHNSRRVDHPCQLPPALMRRLFALFTHPGEIVLDCFNGAGTSSLVAEEMGRRFLGIELSEQYHRLALERHEALRHGRDPFAKASAVPHAKNSRVQRVPRQKYQVTKKDLQLDVRRIARQIGRLPTRDEVKGLSAFPFEFFETYFLSWGEVCAAARTTGMSESPLDQDGEDDQLLLFP